MNETKLKLVQPRKTYKSMIALSLIIWNIALSSFYFGYSMVYFSNIPIQTLKRIFSIDLEDATASGLLNGCVPVGALFGALGSSFLLAKFSRRKCLLLMNAFAMAVGALLYVPNFYILLLARVLQGVCVGVFSALSPLIIKQLSPTEVSGLLGSYAQLNICLGTFFGCLIAYALKKITGDDTGQQSWYLVFGVTLVTTLFQTFVLIFLYPYETPKYLLSIGQQQQAKKLISLIYKEEYVQQILKEKKNDLQGGVRQRNLQQSTISTIVVQQSKDTVKSLPITIVVAIHLAILQQFSGINAVALYAGSIAGKATSEAVASLMPSLINFQQFLGTFGASILLIKYGRKVILKWGSLFEGIGCGIVAIGFLLQDSSKYLSEYLILIGLFIFMAVFGLSLGPVVWLYIPQIVQPKVVPYSTAANWITASLVVILFPIITQNILDGNPGILFFFFTVWCLGSFVFNSLYLVQTKDKTQTQIREEYIKIKLC